MQDVRRFFLELQLISKDAERPEVPYALGIRVTVGYSVHTGLVASTA